MTEEFLVTLLAQLAALGIFTLCAAITLLIRPVRTFIKRKVTNYVTPMILDGYQDANQDNWWRVAKFMNYVTSQLGPTTETPLYERVKFASRQIAFEEARQRRSLDNSNVGIAESGPNGQTIYVNQTWCDLLECVPSDVYGDGWKNFIHPEDLPAEEVRWEASRRSGGINPPHEMRFITKQTRTVIKVEARAYPLIQNGELVGFVGEIKPLG